VLRGGALNKSPSGGPNARARPPEAATRAPRAPRSSLPTMRGATAAEGASARTAHADAADRRQEARGRASHPPTISYVACVLACGRRAVDGTCAT